MTDDLEPYEETEYPPPRTAVMPSKPHGYRTGIDATQLMRLGADMGAIGLERAATTKIMHTLQATAVKVSLETMPEIIKMIQDATSARINVIMQRIQQLQRVTMPVAEMGWRGALGMQRQMPPGAVYPEYVSLDAVMKELARAQVEPPHMPGS